MPNKWPDSVKEGKSTSQQKGLGLNVYCHGRLDACVGGESCTNLIVTGCIVICCVSLIWDLTIQGTL